ncbi:Putative accessory gene regulator protein B [Clostridium chauvoei JF4335]|nr:Putative accessory gene regulator protein B [Clostridium chauvoei JF4335]
MIQIALSIVSVLIIGAFLNIMWEAFIVSLAITILRKSSGGAHATSPGKCTFIGTSISLIIAIVLKNIYSLNIVLTIVFIGFIISYYLVYKLAPVDSISKPIRNQEKIKRLKKNSIIIVSIYLILVIINILTFKITGHKYFISYALCICGGMLWQVMSLTKFGHKLIEIIEYFINKIL